MFDALNYIRECANDVVASLENFPFIQPFNVQRQHQKQKQQQQQHWQTELHPFAGATTMIVIIMRSEERQHLNFSGFSLNRRRRRRRCRGLRPFIVCLWRRSRTTTTSERRLIFQNVVRLIDSFTALSIHFHLTIQRCGIMAMHPHEFEFNFNFNFTRNDTIRTTSEHTNTRIKYETIQRSSLRRSLACLATCVRVRCAAYTERRRQGTNNNHKTHAKTDMHQQSRIFVGAHCTGTLHAVHGTRYSTTFMCLSISQLH